MSHGLSWDSCKSGDRLMRFGQLYANTINAHWTMRRRELQEESEASPDRSFGSK